jgi:soluble lytic murein transglycosylase
MGILSRSVQLLSCIVFGVGGALGAYCATCAASPALDQLSAPGPVPGTATVSGDLPGKSALAVSSDADADAAVRAVFLAAYERAIAGETGSGGDSASLKAYPLYPYLLAARIRTALNGAPDTLAPADERAATFIAAHASEPVARGLRRAWLESLARRERWDLFLQAYDERGANDELRCESLDARIARASPDAAPRARDDSLTRDIERLWLIPLNLPECEPAFAWLRLQGLLTLELIEQRARLALAAGNSVLASTIVLELPPPRAAPLFQWISLLESPERSIDDLIASPGTPVESAALLAGWSRLAREDPEAAVARYESFVRARGLSDKSASPYALALALALARDRDPAALDYFKRVRPADLDDEAIGWRVRAALWSGDWGQAAQGLAALSDKERQLARWRYWAARSAEQLGRLTEARELYESVLPDDDYYSAMAAARLHRPVVPHPQALPVDREILAALERAPALVRARELFLCGLRSEAALEWQLAYQSLTAPERLQAIRLAASWSWYDQSVAAATAEHVFNDYALLYPRPYDAPVSAAAELSRLSPDLIYGVVRQESLYRTDAVSRAGARGLMQLEPGTARITARYWNRRRPLPSDLFDPYINISLGAARLRMLLDRYEGELPVALAGYDAGVNAVAHWLPSRPIDADIWIENIPYGETRGYVEHVLWHSLLFSWLRAGGEPQRADAWVADVVTPPRGPNVASVGVRSRRK